LVCIGALQPAQGPLIPCKRLRWLFCCPADMLKGLSDLPKGPSLLARGPFDLFRAPSDPHKGTFGLARDRSGTHRALLNVHGVLCPFRESPGGPYRPLKCSKFSLRGLPTLKEPMILRFAQYRYPFSAREARRKGPSSDVWEGARAPCAPPLDPPLLAT